MRKAHESSIDDAIKRIQSGIQTATADTDSPQKATTQKELGKLLGINQSSISDARKRGVLPPQWQLTLLQKFNLNPTWIESGEGDMFMIPSADRHSIVLNKEIARESAKARAEGRKEERKAILEELTLPKAKNLILALLPEGAKVMIQFNECWQKPAPKHVLTDAKKNLPCDSSSYHSQQSNADQPMQEV